MIEAVGCKLRISAQRGPKIARRTVSGYVGSTRSSVIDGEMRRERRRRYASRARYCTERASVPVSRIWSLPRDLRSSSDGVLAQNFAESVDSLDLHRGIKWLGRDVGDRDLEIDPAMRPSCVVMLDELGEYAFEVTRVSDEQPIEALATGGANESLGECVGPRSAHGRLDDPSADASNDFIEGPDELGVPVADQALDDASLVLERHCQVASLLGDPVADRMFGDTSQEDLAVVEVDEKQHVETTQRDRVDVEEVAGERAQRAW